MALDEASHHFEYFRSPEIRDITFRTCPDVELGEECEDQCYLGQGSQKVGKWLSHSIIFPSLKFSSSALGIVKVMNAYQSAIDQ